MGFTSIAVNAAACTVISATKVHVAIPKVLARGSDPGGSTGHLNFATFRARTDAPLSAASHVGECSGEGDRTRGRTSSFRSTAPQKE